MIDVDSLAWDKMEGLLPAVVQDAATGVVLMLGYMDRAALAETLDSGQVTFFSRSKQRLWRKGETSGNVLRLVDLRTDCDSDALLVRADPAGPTCHLGTASCFAVAEEGASWLGTLERIVADRAAAPATESYTARLLADPGKAAQKVGEEGVEVALAAVSRDTDGVAEEAADLLFHLLVVLRSREIPLSSVIDRLRERHEQMRTG
ncbi:bifunctional phosphoribosyl-AMP cyclohydrolase/phosphoribosyl-ATP diphosphatase HisIE [Sphingomonas swuensis]|uniref:Histidine biosynthesis bifunctional protein HisIE n=1 Tax=Sphingomonas swuensis TaxID=977800 RepID=A0ABP7SUN8_9SPHN